MPVVQFEPATCYNVFHEKHYHSTILKPKCSSILPRWVEGFGSKCPHFHTLFHTYFTHHMHKSAKTNVTMPNESIKTPFMYVNECKQTTPKHIEFESHFIKDPNLLIGIVIVPNQGESSCY